MTSEEVRLRYAEVFTRDPEMGEYTESGRVSRRDRPREFRKLEEQYRRFEGQ